MIDEDITYREKGYYSTELSRGSHKPVYAVCEGDNCEREGGRGRWVMFKAYTILCLSCAHKNRHILNECDKIEKLPWVDDGITFAEKGYRSTDLKRWSRRKVWAVCQGENCEREGGRGRWVVFYKCTELCLSCASKDEKHRENISKSLKGRVFSDKEKQLLRENHADNSGENNGMWKGGISLGDYCKFFDEHLKDAVRNYFDNMCFECGETVEENGGRNMSVHHINYQKSCGCDNTQFCVYVPLCMKCHSKTNHNRWYWYNRFMIELSLRNPNYYAYHIPVVFYDEPCYNYGYVFKIRR